MASEPFQLLILSDIHYAAPEEQARGDYEVDAIDRPLLRKVVKAYRRFIWLKEPLAQNHLLDMVLNADHEPDLVIGNGDYTCDSGFVGFSDPAALESGRLCLEKLRSRFPGRFMATLGDHDLGKRSLAGGKGGIRYQSYELAQSTLDLKPFWQFAAPHHEIIGCASSLVSLPLFDSEMLDTERASWQRARDAHIAEVAGAFKRLPKNRPVVLLLHDPSALPYLAKIPEVADKLNQIERTIIGHLHTPLVLWNARLLEGMPIISSLGGAIRKMTSALHQAKEWRPFKVTLCPALAGVELLKDGGYLLLNLHVDGSTTVTKKPLPR